MKTMFAPHGWRAGCCARLRRSHLQRMFVRRRFVMARRHSGRSMRRRTTFVTTASIILSSGAKAWWSRRTSWPRPSALEVLRDGGNAVDSAVAVGFALAVTLPRAGNLGGSGFMLLHLAEEKRTVALEYYSQAPASLRVEQLRKPDGTVDEEKRYSRLGAGIPGTVAGMWHVHQKYGKLPWKRLMQPAIESGCEGHRRQRGLRVRAGCSARSLASRSCSRESFVQGEWRVVSRRRAFRAEGSGVVAASDLEGRR